MLLPQRNSGIPHGAPTSVSHAFWEGCRKGQLLFQRCTCGTANFPPTEHCRQCLGKGLTWERSKGLGTLDTWTVVYRPVVQAFTVPYAPAIVRLDEDFSIMSNVVGCDTEELKAEMRVRVVFNHLDSLFSLPYFQPESLP